MALCMPWSVFHLGEAGQTRLSAIVKRPNGLTHMPLGARCVLGYRLVATRCGRGRR